MPRSVLDNLGRKPGALNPSMAEGLSSAARLLDDSVNAIKLVGLPAQGMGHAIAPPTTAHW